MALPYDKIATIFKENETARKIVTFLKNGGRNEDYDDLLGYVAETQKRMCEYIIIVNRFFFECPTLSGMISRVDQVLYQQSERYRNLMYGQFDPGCSIYVSTLDEFRDKLGGFQHSNHQLTIQRFNEIVQHYNL